MQASHADKQLNCVQSKLSSKSGKLCMMKLFAVLLARAKICSLEYRLQPLSLFNQSINKCSLWGEGVYLCLVWLIYLLYSSCWKEDLDLLQLRRLQGRSSCRKTAWPVISCFFCVCLRGPVNEDSWGGCHSSHYSTACISCAYWEGK